MRDFVVFPADMNGYVVSHFPAKDRALSRDSPDIR